MRGIDRRRNCCVASLIMSTNSGLSATAGSLAKDLRKEQSALCRLTTPFQNASLSMKGRANATP
jgi:hypothetical protein